MLLLLVCVAQLGVVQSYLPAMMSAQEVEAVVVAVVAELGATTQKDMGRVMAAVKVTRQTLLKCGC